MKNVYLGSFLMCVGGGLHIFTNSEVWAVSFTFVGLVCLVVGVLYVIKENLIK